MIYQFAARECSKTHFPGEFQGNFRRDLGIRDACFFFFFGCFKLKFHYTPAFQFVELKLQFLYMKELLFHAV